MASAGHEHLALLLGTEGAGLSPSVLAEADGGAPAVILVATGSEVQLAVEARTALQADGVPTRVVSMPCREWFAAQTQEYRDQVLPPAVRARVSVEAAVGQGWREIVGDAGEIVSLEHFGASADYQRLFREFGITAQAVADAARRSIATAGGGVDAIRPGGTQTTSAPAQSGTGDQS